MSKSAAAASTVVCTPSAVEESPVVTGPVVVAEDVENDDPFVP